MPGVDDDVALHACNYRWDEQDCTSILRIPGATEAAGCLTTRVRPVRDHVRRHHFIAGAPRYRDLDEVLVRRRGAVPVREHLQHGRRIGCGGVNHFGAGLMPSAGDASCAFHAPHRKLTRGIADPIRAQRLPKRSRCRQRATPASARRMRLRTASAPAELERAMSNGVSPSSSGCGRFRNASIASGSP